jgi:hypothetical protein
MVYIRPERRRNGVMAESCIEKRTQEHSENRLAEAYRTANEPTGPVQSTEVKPEQAPDVLVGAAL